MHKFLLSDSSGFVWIITGTADSILEEYGLELRRDDWTLKEGNINDWNSIKRQAAICGRQTELNFDMLF